MPRTIRELLATYDDGDHEWTSSDQEDAMDALRQAADTINELASAYEAFYGGDFDDPDETTRGERMMVQQAYDLVSRTEVPA